MARNTSLMLRVGEAKNLPAKDISGYSDPYCVIKIDNEQVARTATVWRSLCPFWGEEYTLHLPNGFLHLDIYVYDEDIVSGDDLIGKVTLTRERIQREGAPKGLENWFKISRVNKKLETEGEIHVEIKYIVEGHASNPGKLRVKVIEARDLAAKDISGSSDPYVKISFLDQHKQTATIRGSLYPSWRQTFEFTVPHMKPEVAAETELVLNVWDWDRMATDDFMGKVVIPLRELEHNQTYDQWFFLQPKDGKVTDSEKSERNKDGEEGNGTLRVRARLSEERILPSQYYQPLIGLLMDSVSPDKHTLSGPTPLKLLQEVMTLDMMEIANTLVKLYLGHGKIRQFLDVICTEEIQNTGNPNTLFRGNSLATKSVDQVMKIVGMPYLHETIGPVVDRIYEERRLVELDPSRLELIRSTRRPSLKSLPKDKDLLEQSLDTLVTYLTLIRQRILTSVSRMPPVMRLIFKKLQQRIEERWPGPQYEDHKYVGISGFLFLRFFAPATLSPKLFHMKDHHPDARVSRTLTLLAKSVQNMGNLGLQTGKEHWMEPLSPFIKESVNDIKNFIDELVDVDESAGAQDHTRRRSVFHPSVTIKQGYLWKRRWDNVKFMSSFTFKKRYFWLKYDTLAYAKKPNDQVRNNIPVVQICAVERVDRHAFARPTVGQVITRNSQGRTEIIYFQAKDINDMYSWISSIRKTIMLNEKLLDMYHPAIYNKERWTCCSRQGKEAPGCSRCHSRVTIGDWRDPLDPDAEAQTIYSQLALGKDVLRQKYIDSQVAIQEAVKESVANWKEKQHANHHPYHEQRDNHNHWQAQEQHMQHQRQYEHEDPLVMQYQRHQQQQQQQQQTEQQQQQLQHKDVPLHLKGQAQQDCSNGGPCELAPPSPMFLMIADESEAHMRRTTSFQDARLTSVGQLLDVVQDLERAHAVYEKMEQERARGSIGGGKLV